MIRAPSLAALFAPIRQDKTGVDDVYHDYRIDPDIKAVKRMYAAVLLKAIMDLKSVDKEISAASRRWFINIEVPCIVSFEECCEILDFESERVVFFLKAERLL